MHCDWKRGGKICQLISVGRVCRTTLSRLFRHAIQKREKPPATILVCAMQKCDFVLLTDAKVYGEGNKRAIFPSEKIK